MPFGRRLVVLPAVAALTLTGLGVSADATPMLGIDAPEDRYFSPNADGVEDTYSGIASFSEPADVTVTVKDGGGATVRTASGASDGAGDYTVTWDGTKTDGSAAPNGAYTLLIDGTGQATGAHASRTVRVGVDRTMAPAVAISSPAAGSTLTSGDEVRVGVTGRGVLDLGSAALEQDGTGVGAGEAFGYTDWEAKTYVDIPAEPGNLTDGTNSLVAHLTFYDPYFATHEVTSAPRSFTTTSAPTLTTSTTPKVVFPNWHPYGPGSADRADVFLRLGRAATLTTDLVDSTSTVVRTFRSATATDAGAVTDDFEMRTSNDPSAPLLPNGTYTYRAHAVFAGGVVKDVTVTLGVSDTVPALALTAPPSGSTLSGPTPATVTAAGDVKLYYATASAMKGGTSYGLGGTSYDPDHPAQALDFTLDPSSLDDGPANVDVYGYAVDTLGATLYLTAPSTAFTVEAGLEVTGDSAPATLAINGSSGSLATRYTVSRDATVTTQVLDGSTVVKTLENAVAATGGVQRTVTWDGTSATGDAAPGTYTLKVSAVRDAKTATLTRSVTLTRTTAGTLVVTPSGKVSGTVHLRFEPADGVDPGYGVAVYDGSTYIAYLSRPYDDNYQPTGFAEGDYDTSNLTNGLHQLTVKVDDLQTPRVPVTTANPVHLTVPTGATFHPGDPLDSTWPTYGGASVDQPATVTETITSSDGATVRVLTGDVESRYSYAYLPWDGKDTAGHEVPDGDYTVAFHASEDVVPSYDDKTVTVTVASRQLGTVSVNSSQVTVGEHLQLTFTPVAGLPTPTSVSFGTSRYDLPGNGVQQSDGTWTADLDTSQLVDGTYHYFAAVWVPTGNGNYDYEGTRTVPVTVSQPKTVTKVSGNRSFSPDGDGYEDDLQQVVRLSRPADVTVTFAPEGGAVAKTIQLDDAPAGDNYLSWNGAGASPGAWTMHLHAVDASGAAQDLDVPIVVMGAPGALTVSRTTESAPYTLTWTAAAGATTTGATLYRVKHGTSDGRSYVGELVATATPGVFSLTVDPAAVRELVSCSGACVYRNVDLPNGTWDYTADVSWKDAAGAERSGGQAYTSPVVGVTSSVAPRVLDPLGNGFIGSNGVDAASTYSTTALRTSQPTNASVVITDADGHSVATLGRVAVTKDSSEPVSWAATGQPDGAYTLSVIATEPGGKTGVSSSTVVVRRAAVGAFTAPAAGEVVAGTVHVVWHTAAAGVSRVRFLDANGFQIGEGVASGADWAADVPASDIGDGQVDLDAVVTWLDATGAQHTFHDRRRVDVQQQPHVSGLPGGSWFTPNGDGFQDSYRATFGTSARGLLVTATVEDGGGTTVRTLLTSVSSKGQYADQCDHRGTDYQCDVVAWDGKDDHGDPVPNGLYTLRVVAANVAGATDSTTTPVGVERRAPMTSSLVDGAFVADALDISYSPTPAFTGTVGSVQVGVSGVLSALAATEQGDGTRLAHFDLPSSLPTDLAFTTLSSWTDGFGASHQVVSSVLAHQDRASLDLVATLSKRSGFDPLTTTFALTATSGAAGPVTWTVDPGDGTTPTTGELTSPYPPVSLPVTYALPGTYHALVTVTSGGQRRHEPFTVTVKETPPVRPTVSLAVSPAKGIVPVDATASLTATTTDGSALSYTLDWGDGTSTDAATISGDAQQSHTYDKPATDPRGYRVRLTVTASHGTTTTTTYQDAFVLVAKDEPLAAVVKDGSAPVVAVNGQAVPFDGSASTPAVGVDFGWDFGDGGTADDAVTSHAFDTPGVYVVNLTVTKGTETKTTAQTVRVLDKDDTSVSHLTVTDAGGGGLAGAMVAYRSPEGDLTRVTTGGDGVATIYGLPEGPTSMDVYAPDHTPSVATVTVTGKVGTGSVDLPRGPLGEATVTTTRITPEIAASEYGVDLDSDANKLFNEYTVELHYHGVDGDQPLRVRGAFTPDGSVGRNIFEDPDGKVPNDCIQKDDLGNEHYICTQGAVGGAQIQAKVEPTGPNQDPTLIVMAVKVKGGQLKEFYGVDLVVKNLAAPGSSATLEQLKATLDYDHTGLSLAAVTGTPQSDTRVLEGAVPAQGEATASWVLSGEKAGTYPVKVLIDGRLMPFDVPATFESKPSDVKVYGADALKLVVQAQLHVTKDQPAHYRIGFENTTKDAPVYGVSVEIPPSGDKYRIQPGQDPLYEFKDPIQPGKRAFADFYLVPTFTGDLNLQESVITHTKGDATKQPVLEALDDTTDENKVVTLTATPTSDGRTQVTWDALPGASSYRLYAPASLAGGFGEAVGSYSGGQVSTVIDTPDSFVDGGAALRRGGATRSSLEATSFVKQLVLQSVVNGAAQLRHKIVNAVASYTCGQAQTVAGVTLSGCLNKQTDGSFLADSSQGKIGLNGLVIEPVSGDVKVKISSATNAVSASAKAVKVGLDLGDAGVVPLYQGPLSLDLTKDWSLALAPKTLLGLPVGGSASLHKTADGTSQLTVKASAPALLGGVSGDLKLTTSASGGTKVDGVSFAIAKGNLGGLVGYSGSLDLQSATASGTTWKVTGSAGTTAASGSLSYDPSGAVTSGSLHASGIDVAGLVTLSSFDLSTTGSGSWKGAMQGSSHGVAVDVSGSYTVDDATNKVTSASLKAPTLSVKDLFSLRSFSLDYAGTDASTWSASGTVVAAGATPTFSATLASDADGIASGHLSVTKLPFGGIATLQDLGLAYSRAGSSWSGQVTVDLPGSPAAGKGSFSFVDGALKDVHVAIADARFGGLVRLQDAAFDYTAATSAYRLTTSTADLANLVGLTSFSATRDDTSWSVSGAGSGGSVSGSVVYTGGQLSSGALSVDGVNLAGLLPLGRLDLSFGGGAWSATAGAGDNVVSFTMSNGKVTKGSIKVPKATLAGVIPVGFHMDYDGDADTWSAGGDAALPGGKTGAMTVDVTYTKGVLTDAKLGGTIGLKGGLELRNLDVSYTATGEKWHGGLDVVLPGPQGTTIGGTLDLAHGAFVGASAKVSGVSVPLGAGVFLTDADVSAQLEPSILLQGRIALSVGPKVAGRSAVAIDTQGSIELRDDGSAVYKVDGKVLLVGNELANAGLAYDTNGETTFHGGFGYGVPGVARVSADLKGGVNANGFNVLTTAQLELLGIDPATLPSASAVVSTRGVAACAKLAPQFDWQTGFGYSWGDPAPRVLEKSCDIGPWIDPSAPALRRGSARSFDVAGSTFTVASGQKVMALEWVGDVAPPVVTLTSPSGAVLVTPVDPAGDGVQPGGTWVSLRNGVTRYVLLDKPAAGTWQVSVAGTVVSSAVARQAPVTDVTGTLSGTGTSRVLSYAVSGTDTVRFVETLPGGGTRELGTADPSGSLPFTTVPGDGSRVVKAVVERDGALVRVIDLLSYDVASSTVVPLATPTPTVAPTVAPGGGTGGGSTGGGSTGGGSTGGGSTGGSTGGGGVPSATATATPSGTPSATPSATPAAGPSGTPSATPSATPTAGPTAGSDTVAPRVGVAALPSVSLGALALRYAGADDGSGIASYDVRYRRAPLNGGFGPLGYPTAWQRTTSLNVALPPSAGSAYCFSVRARDKAGNVSGWSKEQCTVVPLDDRHLTATSGWVRSTGSAYYAATVTRTAKAGQTLTRTGLVTRSVSLVAATCPTCGAVGVYWNGALLKTVSLRGATGYRKVLPVVDFGAGRSGTLTIRSLGAVQVDGVVVRR